MIQNLTLADISNISHRSVLKHKVLKNKDGSALRCRINGKIKTWKTRPGEFQVPVKHGLRDCFYITQTTISDWYLE